MPCRCWCSSHAAGTLISSRLHSRFSSPGRVTPPDRPDARRERADGKSSSSSQLSTCPSNMGSAETIRPSVRSRWARSQASSTRIRAESPQGTSSHEVSSKGAALHVPGYCAATSSHRRAMNWSLGSPGGQRILVLMTMASRRASALVGSAVRGATLAGGLSLWAW